MAKRMKSMSGSAPITPTSGSRNTCATYMKYGHGAKMTGSKTAPSPPKGKYSPTAYGKM